MTAGVLLEAMASLLTVELFDEVPGGLLVPEPLLEYERLLEYGPPLKEKLVCSLLLVYPGFLDQPPYFSLVELLKEPLCFVLVYPDFVLVYPDLSSVDPDFVPVYPGFLPVVEPEFLFPFKEDLGVSLSEYARRGVDYPSQSRSLLAARLGFTDYRLRQEGLVETEPYLPEWPELSVTASR